MDDSTIGIVTTLLLGASALGTAMVAGVFFAFSTFVMSGLDRAGTAHAVPAMQGINLAAVRPPLMLLLFGTLILLLTSAGALMVDRGWSLVTGLAITAFLIYGAGVVVVTASGNVPLNNRLARSLDGGAAAAAWPAYAGPWTRLNHLRTVTAALSAGLMLVTLVLG